MRISARGGLAAAALAYGLLITYGGAGHTIVVAGAAVRDHRTYDFRLAMLLVNGGVLLAVGLTNAVLSRWIARGAGWALAWSAAATVGLAGYCALLLPVPAARPAAGPALALSCGYLLAIVVFGTAARKHDRATKDSGSAT